MEQVETFSRCISSIGTELEQLLVQGHKQIPLQCVDIDKNEHKRRENGPHVDWSAVEIWRKPLV